MSSKNGAEIGRASCREVFEEWRRKDPILLFDKFLIAKKLMTPEEKAAIEDRIEREIREDVAFAESSPFPQPQDAARPVCA